MGMTFTSSLRFLYIFGQSGRLCGSAAAVHQRGGGLVAVMRRGAARESAPNSGPKFLARRQSTIGIGGKLALSSLYVLPVAYLSSSSSAQ